MTYLKAVLVGLVAMVAAITFFTAAIMTFSHLDPRWMMGYYWFLSLPILAAVFLLGFIWRLRRGKRAESRPHGFPQRVDENKTIGPPLY